MWGRGSSTATSPFTTRAGWRCAIGWSNRRIVRALALRRAREDLVAEIPERLRALRARERCRTRSLHRVEVAPHVPLDRRHRRSGRRHGAVAHAGEILRVVEKCAERVKALWRDVLQRDRELAVGFIATNRAPLLAEHLPLIGIGAHDLLEHIRRQVFVARARAA